MDEEHLDRLIDDVAKFHALSPAEITGEAASAAVAMSKRMLSNHTW